MYLPRNSFLDGDTRGRIKAGEFCASCAILSFSPTSTVFTIKNTCLTLSLISFGQILLRESAIPVSEAENGHELTVIPFRYMYATLIGVILFLIDMTLYSLRTNFPAHQEYPLHPPLQTTNHSRMLSRCGQIPSHCSQILSHCS